MHPINGVVFDLTQEASKEEIKWARFCALLYPDQSVQYAEEFWGSMGDGISSRHAEFCLKKLPFMDSMSSEFSLRTRATYYGVEILPLDRCGVSDSEVKARIKDIIAEHATSEDPRQKMVAKRDVFLYPKGMTAIGYVARALTPASPRSSEAVIFG